MNCTECHHEIPAGMAVIRSSNFRKLAWHRECYAWQVIPAQRTAVDEKVEA